MSLLFIIIVQQYRAGVIVILEACSVLLLRAYLNLAGLLLPSLYLHFFKSENFEFTYHNYYNSNGIEMFRKPPQYVL